MLCLECSKSCGQTVSQKLNIHLSGLNLEYPQDTSSMKVHHLTVKLTTGRPMHLIYYFIWQC